jgi:hypothetical protein
LEAFIQPIRGRSIPCFDLRMAPFSAKANASGLIAFPHHLDLPCPALIIEDAE